MAAARCSFFRDGGAHGRGRWGARAALYLGMRCHFVNKPILKCRLMSEKTHFRPATRLEAIAVSGSFDSCIRQ